MDNNPFSGIPLDVANMTANINRSMNAIAQIRSEKNAVPFRIAENTDEINKKVKSIDENISAERSERKIADIELQKAIDEVRRIQRFANLKALAIGIICAAAGVAFSVIAKGYGLL